jgi:hypothetical protein
MSISVGTLTIEMAANVARLQKDMAAAKKTVNDAMTSIKSGASSAMNALAGLGRHAICSGFCLLHQRCDRRSRQAKRSEQSHGHICRESVWSGPRGKTIGRRFRGDCSVNQ